MKDSTITILKEKLQPKHISQRSKGGTKLSYIESHHAIREANRAFGFDGWSYGIIDMVKVSEEKNTNGNHVIGYTARVCVMVGDIQREDVGFGSGISKMLADAHEGATKEAISDAMKRALRTFGDIFGLALYDKTQAHVGEVKKPVKKTEPITIDSMIIFINSCKTVKSLEDYYNENKDTIDGFFKKEKEEVVEAFAFRKSELKAPPGPNSESMRTD